MPADVATINTAVGAEPVGSVFDFVFLVMDRIMEMWEVATVDPKMIQRAVGSVLIVTASEFQKPTL